MPDIAECTECGYRALSKEFLQHDPNDTRCPKCGADEVIYLLSTNEAAKQSTDKAAKQSTDEAARQNAKQGGAIIAKCTVCGHRAYPERFLRRFDDRPDDAIAFCPLCGADDIEFILES